MRFNPIIVKTGGSITPTPTEWTRPADWIAIPNIATEEEVVYLLAKVNEYGANYCAILMKGAYTVDWGDGIIENFNSNVKAEHSYLYENCGNLSTLGYKQALIKVTPQTGQTLNYVNINQVYTGIATGKSSIFLDVVMNIPNVSGSTNLYIGNVANVYHRICERVWIKEVGAVTTTVLMFYNCTSLQSVPLFNTANVTTMVQMFINCYSLQSVPLFNTANVTTMAYMFQNCNSLQSVPLFNTANVTTMVQMFYNCYSLQSVPLFNTANVTTMYQMFQLTGSITNVLMTNIKTSISVSSNLLTAIELNRIFGNLVDLTGQTAQSITITGNIGASTCDTSLATTKNWTVIN